jgi:hypothetical protein
MTLDQPKFSICQRAIPNTAMGEDVGICVDLGIECMGIEELKMEDGGDDDLRETLCTVGVKAGICSPATLSLLPSPALPDSIWRRPPRDWIEEGRQGFHSAWASRGE